MPLDTVHRMCHGLWRRLVFFAIGLNSFVPIQSLSPSVSKPRATRGTKQYRAMWPRKVSQSLPARRPAGGLPPV